MKPATVLSLLFCLGCGITDKLPPIKGFHWRRNPLGAELYRDSDGRNVASFAGGGPGSSAQVCTFAEYAIRYGCKYFEKNQQALTDMADFFNGGGGNGNEAK